MTTVTILFANRFSMDFVQKPVNLDATHHKINSGERAEVIELKNSHPHKILFFASRTIGGARKTSEFLPTETSRSTHHRPTLC